MMSFEEKVKFLQENKEKYTVYIDFEYVEAVPKDEKFGLEVIEFNGQPRDIMFDVFQMFGLDTDQT